MLFTCCSQPREFTLSNILSAPLRRIPCLPSAQTPRMQVAAPVGACKRATFCFCAPVDRWQLAQQLCELEAGWHSKSQLKTAVTPKCGTLGIRTPKTCACCFPLSVLRGDFSGLVWSSLCPDCPRVPPPPSSDVSWRAPRNFFF